MAFSKKAERVHAYDHVWLVFRVTAAVAETLGYEDKGNEWKCSAAGMAPLSNSMLGLVSFFVNLVSHNDAKYYENLQSSRMQLCARRIALVTRRIR